MTPATLLPQARSLRMDTETLLAHPDLWVQEERPETGLLLGLSDEQQQVYAGLRDHRWGQGVRLEQERIGWDWAWGRVLAAVEGDGG